MAGVIRVRLQPLGSAGFERAVAHRDFARLAVQLEEHRTAAVRMGFAERQEFDDQALAGFDIDGDLFAFLHAEEKLRRRQDLDVVPRLLRTRKLDEHFRVHEVAQYFVVFRLAANFLFDRPRCLLEIHRA